MLIIDQERTLSGSIELPSEGAATRVALSLIAEGVGFYLEPLPGAKWKLIVNVEAVARAIRLVKEAS